MYCSSNTLRKTYFEKLRLNVTNSRQQILELTSLVDRDQKQLAIIEFPILVEVQSINQLAQKTPANKLVSKSQSYIYTQKSSFT